MDAEARHEDLYRLFYYEFDVPHARAHEMAREVERTIPDHSEDAYDDGYEAGERYGREDERDDIAYDMAVLRGRLEAAIDNLNRITEDINYD